MKRIILYISCLILAVACSSKQTGDTPIPHSELYGTLDEAADEVFRDVQSYGTGGDIHSLLIIKDGKLVYEKYSWGHDRDELHIMWSATKTFTSTAIALAVQDGLLSLSDPLYSFFGPEEIPAEPSEWQKKITLKDVITMSSGLQDNGAIGAIRTGRMKNPTREFLSQEPMFEPGTKYKYSSANTYLLSAIITRKTGLNVMDYLKDRVLEPLGIRRYEYEESAEGLQCGGWGLYITSESLGKLGQLWLQRGVWEGKRIIDDEWFTEATKAQIYQKGELPSHENFEADDWNSGYGYQVWICTHDSFRIDGAHGQVALVIPSKNTVVVTTGFITKKPDMINSIWKHIYPLL